LFIAGMNADNLTAKQRFDLSVTREMQRIMHEAQRELEDRKPDWPSVDEQEEHWRSLDDGRSDGQGESFAERNT
jgi:hypothetical protein